MILPPDEWTTVSGGVDDNGTTILQLRRRSNGTLLGWAVRHSDETSWEVSDPADSVTIGRATDLRHAAIMLRHHHRRST